MERFGEIVILGRTFPMCLWLRERASERPGLLREILEAARQVKRTGLQVGSPAVLHSLMTWTQMKALNAGWTRKHGVKAGQKVRLEGL